jgi:hypothetical protein
VYLLRLQRSAGNSAATSLVQRAGSVAGAVLRQPLTVQREESEGGGQESVTHRSEIKDPAKLQAFLLGGKDAFMGKNPKEFMERAELGYVFSYADGYDSGLGEWMQYWDHKDYEHITGHDRSAPPNPVTTKEGLDSGAKFAAGHVVDVAVESRTEHAVGTATGGLIEAPVPVALIFELATESKSDTPMFDPDERKKQRTEYVEQQRQTLREAKEARVNEVARTREGRLDDEDAGSAEENAKRYESTKNSSP